MAKDRYHEGRVQRRVADLKPGERYPDAIWKAASEGAQEMSCNTDWSTAPILNVWTYRKWERECVERIRQEACEQSKRLAASAVLFTE